MLNSGFLKQIDSNSVTYNVSPSGRSMQTNRQFVQSERSNMSVQLRNVLWVLVLGLGCTWIVPAFAQEALSEVKSISTDNEEIVFASKQFDAPEMIMVGQLPLNSKAKQMYPSPVMFDVDNDNRVELIVGDIFGSLNVYENQNESATGNPVWADHVPLESTEGKPIKVSNW